MRLQEGKHNVEVLRAGFTESSNQTPGITLKFGNDYGDIDHVLWITAGTRDRVIENLETLGIPGKALDEYDTLMRLDEMLKGNACEIVVGTEEYRGEQQVKVKWINPAKPVTNDLMSRIYGTLTGKPAPRAAGPTPTARPPATASARPPQRPEPPPLNDEVPF